MRAFDAVSTKLLGPVGVGPMLIMLKLHTDMFAGQPGKLFLGGMGLLFAIAIISGVVLYWPFTRRLRFATIRDSASRRVRWLDWHNLIGVVTVAWALVVGLTGVVNTWAELMLNQWKATELASMVAPYAGKPPPVASGFARRCRGAREADGARDGGRLHRVSGHAVHVLAPFRRLHARRHGADGAAAEAGAARRRNRGGGRQPARCRSISRRC